MEAITTPPCQTLVQTVLECHPQQQLYLLGSITTQQKATSVFRKDHPTCTYTSHYFLLSLVRAEEPALTTLQDKIENTLAASFTPCTAMVLGVERFNQWLTENHPFVVTIYLRATLLHDAGFLLPEPQLLNGAMAQCENGKERRAAKEMQIARQFFAGAAFYRERSQYPLAMFMLHQCTEQCLRILLRATTGYCPHTHNIDKLVRYCSMTVHKITEIFHSRSQRQARLYRLLRDAYTEPRYGVLPVKREDVEAVTFKVEALLKILKEYGRTA